jgi:hypothetical protein
MTAQLPPMPDQDIPVIVQTSFSTIDGDLSQQGIDTRTDWWCEVTRRPRRNDAIASLYPPGATRHTPLFDLVMGSEDLNETEAVGHQVIRLGRILVRLIADPDDQEAWEALKGKGLPQGYPRFIRSWLAGYDELGARIEALQLTCPGWGGELWTVSMVAEYLGYTGPTASGTARKQLSRWGIVSQGREPGRGGQSQYLASEVRAAHEARPGRGRWAASRTQT